MRLAALAAALCLAGCVTVSGPVTITRTLSIGIYHRCLSYGIGIMLCEQIHFDPNTCAMVLISPKPPSKGVIGVLRSLGQQVQAICLSDKETTP